eukprot:TRINITY_DN9418_c0_g2_i1.p1 TRINITY_DN9418_c0_g2~~TRINITY_DN9418_c0_g2_i1.p1  ORF type:complete len:364 (+),score=81.80 TRINITY_DN9418_c0_g2_i1:993-2084(+)
MMQVQQMAAKRLSQQIASFASKVPVAFRTPEVQKSLEKLSQSHEQNLGLGMQCLKILESQPSIQPPNQNQQLKVISQVASRPALRPDEAAAAWQKKSRLFKTQLCVKFARGGCSFGLGCWFAHSDSELRKSNHEGAAAMQTMQSEGSGNWDNDWENSWRTSNMTWSDRSWKSSWWESDNSSSDWKGSNGASTSWDDGNHASSWWDDDWRGSDDHWKQDDSNDDEKWQSWSWDWWSSGWSNDGHADESGSKDVDDGRDGGSFVLRPGDRDRGSGGTSSETAARARSRSPYPRGDRRRDSFNGGRHGTRRDAAEEAGRSRYSKSPPRHSRSHGRVSRRSRSREKEKGSRRRASSRSRGRGGGRRR